MMHFQKNIKAPLQPLCYLSASLSLLITAGVRLSCTTCSVCYCGDVWRRVCHLPAPWFSLWYDNFQTARHLVVVTVRLPLSSRIHCIIGILDDVTLSYISVSVDYCHSVSACVQQDNQTFQGIRLLRETNETALRTVRIQFIVVFCSSIWKKGDCFAKHGAGNT